MKINCSWAPLLILKGPRFWRGTWHWTDLVTGPVLARLLGAAGVSSQHHKEEGNVLCLRVGTFNTAPDFSKYTNGRFMFWRNSLKKKKKGKGEARNKSVPKLEKGSVPRCIKKDKRCYSSGSQREAHNSFSGVKWSLCSGHLRPLENPNIIIYNSSKIRLMKKQ